MSFGLVWCNSDHKRYHRPVTGFPLLDSGRDLITQVRRPNCTGKTNTGGRETHSMVGCINAFIIMEFAKVSAIAANAKIFSKRKQSD